MNLSVAAALSTYKQTKLITELNTEKRNRCAMAQKYSIAHSRVKELESYLAKAGLDHTQIPDDVPLTELLIHCISTNSQRKPNGRRYKNLEKYFILLSFMGPHYYGFLHATLFFPSYRTVLDYRNKLLAEMKIDADSFNGSPENIHALLRYCLPANFNSKVVLAIDAASVTPDVYIHPNGTVTGVLKPPLIDAEEASIITSDLAEYDKFVSRMSKQLIKAEFVMMLIPIDATLRSFPICCIPAIHATASEQLFNVLDSTIAYVKSVGITIAGVATDGDRQYLKLSTTLLIRILDDIVDVSEQKVSAIIAEFCTICHFSDPFHLVKRDRYRKVASEPYVVDPWDRSAQCSRKDLTRLGIPSYLMSQDQVRKMEDSLPLKLFTLQTLGRIIDDDNPRLFFAMLPSTFLLESIHSDLLSRSERIEYLMIGASLLLLYELYKNELAKCNYVIKDKKYDRIPRGRECFTSAWSAEYISVAFSIVSLLYTEDTLHLGACGTHILEHYFGAIRRHSGGEDTHVRFISSMKKVLLEQHLLTELEIPRDTPHKRSDSGYVISDRRIREKTNLMYYLRIARGLLGTIMHIPSSTQIYSFAYPGSSFTLEAFAVRYLHFPAKPAYFASGKMTGKLGMGGFGNQKRWMAANQIQYVADGDE
jgi:hypothetical protein